MAANAAIKQAAAKKARPASAPTAPKRAPVERYTGLMAAPLNELSTQEARVRDVTARRQSDAVAYNAFVLGQQGKLAAASAASDQQAVQNIGGAQAMAAGANLGAMDRMVSTRAAQGIEGPVPTQQLAGLRDDAVRTNMLMAAGTRDAAEVAQSNQGKAAFLQAASQQGHRAAVARIAGEGSEQEAGIRREKVGLLGQRDQMAAEIQQAEAQAAADIEKARIAAAERAADRSSRENIALAGHDARGQIAAMQVQARQMEGETDRQFEARQRRADRRVRLRTSTTNAKAMGYVDPKERKARGQAVARVQSQRDAAVSAAKNAVRIGGVKDPDELRSYLTGKVKDAPREVIDYAMAAALRARAGVTPRGRKSKSAARRYYDYERRVRSGRA